MSVDKRAKVEQKPARRDLPSVLYRLVLAFCDWPTLDAFARTGRVGRDHQHAFLALAVRLDLSMLRRDAPVPPVLGAHCRNLQTLTLDVCGETMAESLVAILRANLATFRGLARIPTSPRLPRMVPGLLESLSQCPLLETLELDCEVDAPEIELGASAPHWRRLGTTCSHLRHLRLATLRDQGIAPRVLSGKPLETLVVNCFESSTVWLPQLLQHAETAKHLRVLDLYVVAAFGYRATMDALGRQLEQLPALEALTLRGWCGLPSVTPPDCVWSLPALTSLDWTDLSCPVPTLHAPLLRSFSVLDPGVRVPEVPLTALSVRGNSPGVALAVLTGLQELDVHCAVCEETLAVVAQLGALRRLRLTTHSALHPIDVFGLLRRLPALESACVHEDFGATRPPHRDPPTFAQPSAAPIMAKWKHFHEGCRWELRHCRRLVVDALPHDAVRDVQLPVLQTAELLRDAGNVVLLLRAAPDLRQLSLHRFKPGAAWDPEAALDVRNKGDRKKREEEKQRKNKEKKEPHRHLSCLRLWKQPLWLLEVLAPYCGATLQRLELHGCPNELHTRLSDLPARFPAIGVLHWHGGAPPAARIGAILRWANSAALVSLDLSPSAGFETLEQQLAQRNPDVRLTLGTRL